MIDLPSSYASLCGLALLFGAQHGFDADHLAAVDALARANGAQRTRLASAAGAFFALGHGAIVVALAVLAALAAQRAPIPAWLGATGIAFSGAVLLYLAALNLDSLWRARRGAPARVAALPWTRLPGRLSGIRRPLGIAAVGAVFAVSFDTISQTALLAAAGVRSDGTYGAAGLALCFVAGMLVVDGASGWWLGRTSGRPGRASARAGRAVTLTVACASLVLGSLAIARLLAPALDAWLDRQTVVLSVCLCAAVACAFLTGVMTASHQRAPGAGD